jgi:tetratricopeptide (TPR) repeat protein
MVLSWPALLCSYLRLLIWPVGLSEFYDFSPVIAWDLRRVVIPSLLILSLTGLLLFTWKKSHFKSIPFGSMWIVLWLGPAWYIRTFQPGEILHDRYLYLSSVGFCLLAGTAISIFIRHYNDNRTARQLLVSGALIVVLIGLNVSQHRFWRDDVALYERGVRTAPKNRKVKLNLANALVERGRYEEGIPIYLELHRDTPRDWPVLYDLGFSYYQLGKFHEAESYLHEAIAVDTSNADEHKFAGLTLAKLGRSDLAEQHLKTAARLKPSATGYHMALAQFYEEQGRHKEAIREFEAELTLSPDNKDIKQHIEELKRTSGSVASRRIDDV